MTFDVRWDGQHHNSDDDILTGWWAGGSCLLALMRDGEDEFASYRTEHFREKLRRIRIRRLRERRGEA